MRIRDRVRDLRRVRAGDLIPDPRNWRLHPQAQENAIRGMLDLVGWADAILVRESEAGLHIIDGHLRASLDPEEIVPVLVLDLDEDEAAELLTTLDPLAGMAETDADKLGALMESMEDRLPPEIAEHLESYKPDGPRRRRREITPRFWITFSVPHAGRHDLRRAVAEIAGRVGATIEGEGQR